MEQFSEPNILLLSFLEACYGVQELSVFFQECQVILVRMPEINVVLKRGGQFFKRPADYSLNGRCDIYDNSVIKPIISRRPRCCVDCNHWNKNKEKKDNIKSVLFQILDHDLISIHRLYLGGNIVAISFQ